MDFSAFQQSSFEAKEWVNAILAQNRPVEDPLEAHLQGIIMKLQMHALEVGNQLEDTSNQALAAIPRVLREVERLRKEVLEIRAIQWSNTGQMLMLKEKLNSFNERLYRIENHTDRSVRVLADIDRAKTRMEDCLKALEQVDKLSKLTADIEAVFATNDYRRIAEKIELMQHSVSILHGVEEYRDSVAQLSRLQTRLESMVAPFIEQAIASHNVNESLDLMKVLQRIKRTEVFSQAYIAFVGNTVESSWNTGAKSSPAEDPTHFLSSFFDHTSNIVAAETRWSSQVFPKDSDVTSAVITAIAIRVARLFSPLLELLSSRLRALPLLLFARASLQDFAQSLLPGLGETAEAIAQRQRLQRQLLAPFLPHQLHFPTLDRAYIADELDALKAPLDGEHMAVIRRVEESVPKLMLLLEASQARCVAFTRCEHAEALLLHLTDIILDYTQHQQKAVQALRVRASLDSAPLPASLDGPASVGTYDWSLFQGALRLQQVTSNLTSRLLQFDKTLRQVLVEQRAQLFGENCITACREQGISRFVERNRGKFSVTDDNPDRIVQLLNFLNGISPDGPNRVLHPAVKAVSSLQSAAHAFAFDSVFQFVRGILGVFHTIKMWNAEESTADVYSAQSLATGSTSAPLPYITLIGNHLWTLSVQHFDTASSSEKQGKAPANEHAIDGEAEGGEAGDDAAEGEALGGVAAQWVASVAKATVSLYIQRILELKSLSTAGAKQLVSDISYLCNFLSGMSIQHDARLVRLLELLPLSPAELKDVPKTTDEVLQKLTEAFVGIRAAGVLQLK